MRRSSEETRGRKSRGGRQGGVGGWRDWDRKNEQGMKERENEETRREDEKLRACQ